MASLKYWIWLASLRGVRLHSKLLALERFASPEEVYYADQQALLQTEGLSKEEAALLCQSSLDDAQRILADCAGKNIFVLTMDDALYPQRLRNIYEPPLVLYGRGAMPLFDEEVGVAVVGTRSCTPYGIHCAQTLGCQLAQQGALVISGMAKGIDGAAMHGALLGGGFTCGVLGGGVDVVYPAENRRLYEDVAASGVLLSEYPPKAEPLAHHFPVRNRIISGLSLATLVVEAGERSGALITANAAIEQGRDVFAVPGPIDAPSSAGCHSLIREGAGLVSCAGDLLSDYRERYPGKLRPAGVPSVQPALSGAPRSEKKEKPAKEEKDDAPSRPVLTDVSAMTEEQLLVLRCLNGEIPMLTDDIAEKTSLPVRRVLSALTLLEIDGYAAKSGAQQFVRLVDIKEKREENL